MNGKNRLQQVQEDVEDVKVIMLDNLNKAEERSGKLGELENRADQLLEQSKNFSKTAAKLKEQKWYEQKKIKVGGIVGAVFAVIIIIVIIVVVSFTFGS